MKQENVALRADRDRTRALLMRARTIAYDNRRLRSLLAIRDRAAEPVVTARLVSSSASSGRRYALLNAGRWSGVKPGMPVRGPDGLIGRVVETGPNAARVLLLSDGDSIVPVRRTRDGLPAIAAGRGDGMVDIRSVNATNVRFNAGDLFVTTGTGGIYGPGVPVARVAKAGSDSVMARTFADPDTLDFALVENVFMPVPRPARSHNSERRAMSRPRVVDSVDYKPFETKLPASRARAIPWATVMAGSLITIIPVVATIPLLPRSGSSCCWRGDCSHGSRSGPGQPHRSAFSTIWSAASRSAARY
ncbi:rod shape-determining protein MreC [Sphingomonas aurantiaca]|uniref:rod shape-determining protein MreC n=1 Tax=Sphingomonas aurantiaca TaxID=185949 RepID=UPI002FE0F39A